MDEDNDFFGDVFDEPENDPLLEGESMFSGDSSPHSAPEEGAPSWMSDEKTNGKASSGADQDHNSEAGSETDPERKEIVVDQRKQDQQGLHELNEAVGQGWRLVRISLARPDGQQAASREEAERFVAILEQERPQSLFDFGAR